MHLSAHQRQQHLANCERLNFRCGHESHSQSNPPRLRSEHSHDGHFGRDRSRFFRDVDRLRCCLRPILKSRMKTTVGAARAQRDQGKSPFSAVACLLLLLFAGILVKFAAFTPIFHAAH
jgi:hypothetical protein